MSEATRAAMRARLIRKGLLKEPPPPVEKPKKAEKPKKEEPVVEAVELQGEESSAVQAEEAAQDWGHEASVTEIE